ncbi:methyltransferase [Streptomyces sp. NPDC003077]|uniref:methyltransferase n=1 Tax=Streptomyces sp. NPDC003077 TaxID=3154443 RepID=UPI0033A5564C
MGTTPSPSSGHDPGNPAADDPAVRITELSLGFLQSAALATVARLDVADHLADGPRTPEQLAATLKVSADHLGRVLRLLATRGVFREDDEGAFHLTPAADLLRTDSPDSLRDGVLMLQSDLFWTPALRMGDTVRAGATVFDEIHGMPFFDYLARNPEAGEAFDTGMASYSRTENDAIAGAYAFPDAGTVVDVGGGHGGLLCQVLLRNPGLSGILYDQEGVLPGHVLDRPELAGRWELQPGDFFASVPAGADIYLVKRILHDWSDEESVRILKNCRSGMTENSRLLVIDAVIPPGNTPHTGKLLDVLMMTSLNGRERTEADFRELVATAGLKVTGVHPTPSTLSIVEAVVE